MNLLNALSSKHKNAHNERQLFNYDLGNITLKQTIDPNHRNLQIKSTRELAEKGDPAFYTEFCMLYPSFNVNLLSLVPTLIPSETILCAFVKLGYSTKEIAHYTKTSNRSIESRKYRIRKKLNLKRNQSFPVFIQNI